MKSFLQALIISGLVRAAPMKETHSIDYVKRNGVDLPFWYPESTSKTFSISPSLTAQSPADAVKFGTNYLLKQLGLTQDDLEIQQSYTDDAGVSHLYAVRKINGVKVDNHNANVHVKNGQVLAFSSSFPNVSQLKPTTVAATQAKVSLEDAVKIAEKQYGVPKDTYPATLVYLQVPSGKLVYAHQFQLKDSKKAKWYQVSVDAQTGQIIQTIDYFQHLATYKVVKLPKSNPSQGFEVVTDPADKTASPQGWHKTASQSFTNTQGNNVESMIGDLKADGGSSLTFDTNWDPNSEPTVDANQKAAIINNFYISNTLHDISYLYGFNEKAGNFQTSNFGKGGDEGDSVIINNQADGSDNANFATPPDGQRPEMNMYLWDMTTPQRDGSLENSIPLHEYTHGISNRLTGGSRQANCLGTNEAGGMGEGWSDTTANYLTRKEGETRDTATSALGDWVMNQPNGVRKYVYSTDMKKNPLTYSNVQGEVHAIGTVWATMLWEMYWNFVDQYGFSPNYHDPTQMKGNIMAFQLVIGGLTLQPCNPTFISARDAIIAADQAYYGGKNKCLIWKAFAKRGLGTDAVAKGHKNGFKLPTDCN
ncbi:hypothetical protein HK103_007565 [Boothiomyces macroporosus]|uniref:Extracellular metalloproteinase n=1 Tax=Boothiomyces macroporosus TaxID=261099 RepID=A0AAD5UG85_9FUNG|nr:hypothetical protein HK103_007565 [Boothiomyces macroporosus]